MNIFTTGIAFFKVLSELKRFNGLNRAKVAELRAAGDVAAEQNYIRDAEIEFSDRTVERLGLKYEVIGRENIPDKGPVLIMSNHQGYADILSIVHVIRNFQVGFIAKKEIGKSRTIGEAINIIRSIYITRTDPREALKTLNEAKALFEQGFSLAIFPEGTRSRSREMSSFKPGSFKFAQKGNVPILPVTCCNSYQLFEEHNRFCRADQKIVIHPLVHYEKLDRSEQAAAQIAIEEAVRSGLR